MMMILESYHFYWVVHKRERGEESTIVTMSCLMRCCFSNSCTEISMRCWAIKASN